MQLVCEILLQIVWIVCGLCVLGFFFVRLNCFTTMFLLDSLNSF